MSGKKRFKSDSSKEPENSSDEESQANQINVDFSGYEPQPSDFNGIMLLLKQLFLKVPVDLQELSKVIINPDTIGLVVKESESDDDEDPSSPNEDDTVYAVTTIINLNEKKDLQCVKQMLNFIFEKSANRAPEQTSNLFKSILSDPAHKVGFLINERFINLPHIVSGPTFTQLLKEVKTVSCKKPSFKFSHYLMISKFSKVIGPELRKKGVEHLDSVDEMIWANPEEELFADASDAQFDYSVSDEPGLSMTWTHSDNEVTHFRKCMIISAEKLENVIGENFTDPTTTTNITTT